MWQERDRRWVRSSFAMARFEKFMVPLVQKLGRLDCQLLYEGERYIALPQEVRETEIEIVAFDDQLTMSYLWILGAYELVRSLDQRAQAHAGILTSDIHDQITKVKRHFARLRIPLAKMEPAGAFRDTDYEIAYPVLVMDHGIGWFVAPTVCITRRELADELLALLDRLRSVDPAFTTAAS